MDKIEHTTGHEDQLSNLNRIIGQLEGIKKMINDKRYCVDILQQIKAAKSALRTVENNVLNKHIEHCISNAINNSAQSDIQQKIQELQKLLKNYN